MADGPSGANVVTRVTEHDIWTEQQNTLPSHTLHMILHSVPAAGSVLTAEVHTYAHKHEALFPAMIPTGWQVLDLGYGYLKLRHVVTTAGSGREITFTLADDPASRHPTVATWLVRITETPVPAS